jgi:hypothetical protein
MGCRKGLLIAASGVLVWLFGGAIIYFLVENCSEIPRLQADGTVINVVQCPWTFSQSLYFSVQTGLSIGFGLLAESKEGSMAYSIIHILLGSSVVAGALGLFASLAITRGSSFQSEEEKALARASAKLHSDGYAGFKLNEMRDLMVKYPHYANAIIRKVDSEPASASQRVFEFKAADKKKRRVLAKVILQEATEKLAEFKNASVTIAELDALDAQTAGFVKKMGRFIRGKRNLLAAKLAFAIWIAIGTIWSVYADENNFVTALYFAVSTCSTAGMVSVKTVDNQAHVLFTAFFAVIGVPLYGLFLGMFANVLVDGYNNKEVENSLHAKFSASEVEFLEHLSANDDKPEVDFAEFVEFQLLRMGMVDRSLISDIKEQFQKLDKDGTGFVKKEAFLHKPHKGAIEVTV